MPDIDVGEYEVVPYCNPGVVNIARGGLVRGGWKAGAITVGIWLAVEAVAAAGPRHGVHAQDPTKLVAADVWVQEDGGELQLGHEASILPPSQVPLPANPFIGLIPAPSSPDAYTLPQIEGPDLSPGMQLPDLTPLPAWDVYADLSVIATTVGDFVLETAQGRDPFAGGVKAIRFGTTIANVGRHSLEVVGVPTPSGNAADPVRVAASQCVRFAGPRVAGSGRACQEYKPVGSLVLHPQHGHFHIDGFAQYLLLRDRGGKPDTSSLGVVSRSEKVGFCMGDTNWLGQKPLLVDTGWYRECRHTAPNVPATFRQGVSPLWGDSYGPGLPGQHLVVEKVPDGIYWIAITVNPGNSPGAVKLYETSLANNTSYRKVQLSKGGTVAKAL